MLRSTALVILVWLAPFTSGALAQTSTIRPSAPSVEAPPVWSRAMKMPDGRTFVTDGGLMIDAAAAKPATLPTTVMPPESGQRLARNFTAQFTDEVGLRDLLPGDFPNTFKTRSGVSLNGNYVNFLRRVLPSSALLRLRGDREPIVVMVGPAPVAIMMPVAPAR